MLTNCQNLNTYIYVILHNNLAIMARSDWAYINIPIGLYEHAEKFLESKKAKKMGLTSQKDLVVLILRDFLEKWEASEDTRQS